MQQLAVGEQLEEVYAGSAFIRLFVGVLSGLIVINALWGPKSVFLQEGVFFSKAAVVTFGGAYSVLAYVAQQAVEKFGWLLPGEMLDGLGMAETTPGPLIMVVQFVGFMGAYRNAGSPDPLVAGILGSVITTWVTFVPCFFWIFLGAPYIERLRSNVWLSSALSAITAAVVGVVLNLAVWFSIHTIFERVDIWEANGLRVFVPEWSSINPKASLIAVIAILMTFYWKKGMVITLATATMLGLILNLGKLQEDRKLPMRAGVPQIKALRAFSRAS